MLIHLPPESFIYNQELVHGFQRSRKKIFHDRLQWEVKIEDDREIDEFDSAHSHFILSVHENKVIGGVRLTPSEAPNLTYEIFSKYFGEIPVKREPFLLESSRFGLEVLPNMSSQFLRDQTIDLFIGVLKFGLTERFSRIITVVDVRMERTLRLAGWPVERITDVVQIGETRTIIGILPISEDILHSLEQKKGGN